MKSIEEKKLLEFLKEKGIGKHTQYKDSETFDLYFSQKDFVHLNSLGLVKDATEGGLIKGLIKNKNGGIYLLQRSDSGELLYLGLIKPGWYISSAESCQKHQAYFQSLESSVDNFLNSDLSNFKIPENCKIIDAENKTITFLLLHSKNQFIFTKPTVINHLDIIVELENSTE